MGYNITRRSFMDLAAGTAAYGAAQRLAHAADNIAIPHLSKVRMLPAGSPIREPYAPLHGGDFRGAQVSSSPDPLVSYRWHSPKAGDDLQIYALGPITAFADRSDSFLISHPPDQLTVKGTGSVRFDFGVESAAWLEFDSPDLTGSVEMSISEYNEPAIENTGPLHRIKTLAPVRHGNTYRLELNSELYEGVRFGWIHVRKFEKPWHVTAVRAVCQAKPTNYNGTFSSSDELLTRIWYSGAYVVKVNFCKDYFGAILMDRGDRISWTGDAHLAQAVALAAFGNWDFIRENLVRTSKEANDIESYSLYWILSLLDYYRVTGDQETLEQFINLTVSKLEHGAAIYHDPPISFYGDDERIGATFENPNRFECKSAYRMLFVHCCRQFGLAMEGIGQTGLGSKYQKLALGKMQELRTNTRWFSPFGVHALTDTVNTGLITAAERKSMFVQSFSNRLDRISFAPFNQYFILDALARMGRREEALETVRDVWGGQIEYGATTFFEVYNPSWNKSIGRNGAVPNCQTGYTSLAHAWAGGVTSWLSREILGIKPTAPGFRRVDIIPRLGRTQQWISGSVPTPHGAVAVHLDRESGTGKVTIPPGTVGRVGLPGAEAPIRKVSFNGKTVWDGSFHEADGVHGSKQGDTLYFDGVRPGQHALSIDYKSKSRSVWTARPIPYPIPHAGRDERTSGNWGGVYGRDGYILFSYDGAEKDRCRLPYYVAAVHPSSTKLGVCLHAQVTAQTEDSRAPAGDPTNGGTRKLGKLYTAAPAACQQTMTVDIEVFDNTKCRIALYFLDWSKQGRRQAIEIHDLNSLRHLAPVETVEDFGRGKYLIYPCNGAVRIRVDQIRGENAVLNAIFFDPA